MSTINTNLAALNSAMALDRNQDLLNDSIERLSSGSAIVNPGDNPAGVAVSDSLTSDNNLPDGGEHQRAERPVLRPDLGRLHVDDVDVCSRA
jgi:hypothetical protein